MFDVSFVELMIIGIVGLLVLGPEKLPVAARTVGGFVRRARNSWNSVRSEFERELAAEELKRTMRETARDLDLSEEIRAAERDIRATLEPPSLDTPRSDTPVTDTPSIEPPSIATPPIDPDAPPPGDVAGRRDEQA
jgi:sec-independent protein translocase protein TatB